MSDFDLPFIISISVSICVSMIPIILSYIDMRRRLKQEREFSKSMANLINTLREELELFRKQSMTSEDIERQKLLFKQGQQQWKQITDIGKLVWGAIKQAQNEEDQDNEENEED